MVIEPYVDPSMRGIDPWVWWLTLIGVVTGLALFFAPWQRLSDGWLHIAPAVALPQIVAGNVLSHGHSNYFYVLAVGFLAFVFRSRRVVAAYVAATWLAIFSPLLLTSSDHAVTLGIGLIAAPTVATVAVVIALLREQVERSQHAYNELASQAIRLSSGMLRTEADRADLAALADTLIARDEETSHSPIALEPRWTRGRDGDGRIEVTGGASPGESLPART